jgi:CubicO group peptidase (beta-lactamase class C family)
MFTALMLAQLVEAGKVHLSDPVEKYLPEVKGVKNRFPDAPPIQIATHTSGLSVEPEDLPTYLKDPVPEWGKVLSAAIPHTRYEFEPGTRYAYSNIGYAILGAALARAAKQPYTENVEKRILEPLGMVRSAFEPTSAIMPNLSKGYNVRGEKFASETPLSEHRGRGYKVPNGAIYATVRDLAGFVSFQLGEGPEKVLKKTSLKHSLWSRSVQASLELSSGYGRGRFASGPPLWTWPDAAESSGVKRRLDPSVKTSGDLTGRFRPAGIFFNVSR